MSEKQKNTGDSLMKAFINLPEAKKEYLLGYAEGYAGRVEEEKINKTAATAATK